MPFLRKYLAMLKTGKIPVEKLVITKNLSKNPSEYTNLVPQAVAANLGKVSQIIRRLIRNV